MNQLSPVVPSRRERSGAVSPGGFPASPELTLALERALAAAAEAERRLAEQSARIALLEKLAMTDELTGLANRRAFNERLQAECGEARRQGRSGALIYCDLDGFKGINDRLGHAAGDAVLRRVADILRQHVRETDLVARLGGDEFAVLFTRTAWRSAWSRAKALESAMNRTIMGWNGETIAIHASFGVQPYGSGCSLEKVIEQADSLMYLSKRRRTA